MPVPAPRIVGATQVTPLSPEEVRKWMIYAERGASIDQKRGSTSPGTSKASRWPDQYIKDYATRQYLKAWIYSEAHRVSFRAICRERAGWSHRTGMRRVAEAIATITAMVNFERVAEGDAAIVRDEGLTPADLDHATS